MRILVAFALLLATTGGGLSWSAGSTISPIDDSAIHTLSVKSSGLVQDKFGKSISADFVIQCEQNTTILAIVTPGLYVSDLGAWSSVTMRVDKQPSFDFSAGASNDHGWIGITGGPATRAIKKLLGGSDLLVRILPVNETHKDFRFPIAGLNEAIKPLRKACGW